MKTETVIKKIIVLATILVAIMPSLARADGSSNSPCALAEGAAAITAVAGAKVTLSSGKRALQGFKDTIGSDALAAAKRLEYERDGATGDLDISREVESAERGRTRTKFWGAVALGTIAATVYSTPEIYHSTSLCADREPASRRISDVIQKTKQSPNIAEKGSKARKVGGATLQ